MDEEARRASHWTKERVRAFIEHPARQQIGKGGHGVVYVNDACCKGIAIKLSTLRPQICLSFRYEQDTYERIVSHRAQTVGRVGMLPLIATVQDVSMIIDPSDNPRSYCAVIMYRVYRPPEVELGQADQLAVHEHIGAIDADYLELVENRGVYVGRALTMDILREPLSALDSVARDLGRFLSGLHYRARVDGNDLEYILGTTYLNTSTRRIYVIDMDKVHWLEDKPPSLRDEVDALAMVIENEPYFASPEQAHFTAFAEAYTDEAAKWSKIAHRVIKDMVDLVV